MPQAGVGTIPGLPFCPSQGPGSIWGTGGVIHTNTPSVFFVCPNPEDGGGGGAKEGSGERDSGLWGRLTGTLMRGREPGSSQERLEATEDTLEAPEGQFVAAGKKNCGRRGRAEVGGRLLGHNGGLSWVSADLGLSEGQPPPAGWILLFLPGEGALAMGSSLAGQGWEEWVSWALVCQRTHCAISCQPLNLSGPQLPLL